MKKTESYGGKAETPMEYNRYQVSKNKHPQKKSGRFERSERPERSEHPERPERPERSERHDRHDRHERPERPERHERPERPPTRSRPDFPRQKSNLKPQNENNRPDSQGSTSSLGNLASQVVKKVDEYQERTCKYLRRIYDIICESHEIDDIHDFQTRHRRSVEFTNLFVRNHLYQIGRLAENIRVMNGNPIDIVTKVNSLFQLIMQGVQSYLKNLEGFIYNNSPDKLLVLTEYIVNAIKVCFERRVCSIKDKGIIEILEIIDEIRYCLKSCDKNGRLVPRFYEEMERKRQQKQMQNEDFEDEFDDNEQQLGYSYSMVDEHGDGPRKHKSRNGNGRQRILKESRENSRHSRESGHPESRHTYTHPYNDYTCPTDKIWNNEAEQTLIRSREGSEKPRSYPRHEDVPKKPKSAVRKNNYGYPTKSPYDMPYNPYGIPKMKAKPNSAKTNVHGPRLSSSKSSMHNSGPHPAKGGNCAPDRRGSKGINASKSTVHGANLQATKNTAQRHGLQATKSTVHDNHKSAANSKLNASKSTAYEIKKSTSDVSTAIQKQIQNDQLSAIEEEDYESDQQSECPEHNDKKSSKCGSEKHLRFNPDSNSRCNSASSRKSEASSHRNECSSDDNLPENDNDLNKKNRKIEKKHQKTDKNSQKTDKSSHKIDKNSHKIDNIQPQKDRMNLEFLNMLQNPNILENNSNELMKMIQSLTKEKFDELMGPIKAQLVPSPSKAKEIKASVRRVKADVEPLKKPDSATTVERLAPNVQYMLITNDEDDEEDVEVPKAKESKVPSKPSSMPDKKLYKSDSSDEDDDGDVDDCMDFSKFTPDDIRQMAIEARRRRLERIQNHPLYFSEEIDEPWKLFAQVSDQILDDLLESAIKELLTESDLTEKELMEKFIKSELEC
ncbi:protein starmaker-like [Chironomus tepperi]|uniref:protein starmaker-like n=1 Tax=Chironomus tepperi TaxID=113505 RepID=UPI00391F4E00